MSWVFFFKLTVFIWGILICFYSSPNLKHFVLSPHLRALALLFRSLCDVQCLEDVFFILWVIFPDWFCLQFGFTCLTFLFMCLPWSYSPFHSDLAWTARWSPTVLSKCFCFFTRIFFRYLRPNYFLSDKASALILVNFSLRLLWSVKPSLSALICCAPLLISQVAIYAGYCLCALSSLPLTYDRLSLCVSILS